MKKYSYLSLVLITLFFSSSLLASQISVTWEPVDHSVGSWRFFASELTLNNLSQKTLAKNNWRLYFSYVRRVLNDGEGDGLTFQDLSAQGLKISKADDAQSGDYYVLEPLDNFVPLYSGESRVIEFLSEFWAIQKSDAPAGFHIVFRHNGHDSPALAVQARVKMNASDPKQTTRFEGDVMPVQTAALLYQENVAHQTLSLGETLLPMPYQVAEQSGVLRIKANELSVRYDGALHEEAAYLKALLRDAFNDDLEDDDDAVKVQLILDETLDIDNDGLADKEAYTLNINHRGVQIRGSDKTGVFYAVQTLRQLLPLSTTKTNREINRIHLPYVQIADAPRFSYRGMHLDVARHFQSKKTVLRLLDLLASFKINKFHFHITDDEGWRLQVPGIPELTEFGAQRGYDVTEQSMLHTGLGSANDLAKGDGIGAKPRSETAANAGVKPMWQGFEQASVNFVGKGSGYYSIAEFEEILSYAAERHIEVITEIDMPGHARAAVQAMEHRYKKYVQSNPFKANQYRLLDPDDDSKHVSVQGYTDNFVNPCLPSSYNFLNKVTTELAARYRAAGVPLKMIHAGGDELPGLSSNVWWQGSPLCKSNPITQAMGDQELAHYFFTRWHQIITATGASMTGWDDIIHQGLDLPGFVPMPWSNVWGWGREDDAYKYANQGMPVILTHATNLYLDLAYNKDPDEPGYYWANFVDTKKTFEYRPFDIFVNGTQDRMGNSIDPSAWNSKVRLTDAGKNNVLGLQGLLWGENLKHHDLVDYFAFPKMLGVAERAWNRNMPEANEMDQAWARFSNTLGQSILPRLDAYKPVGLKAQRGANYRLPLPGGKISAGLLRANLRYPGLDIEYSLDNGSSWLAYKQALPVSGEVLLRSVSANKRYSRVIHVK